MEILTQISDALLTLKKANEAFHNVKLSFIASDMGQVLQLIEVQKKTYEVVVELLQNTKKAFELLHNEKHKLEMEVHQKNSELMEISLNLLRKQKLLDEFIAQASLILQAPSDDKNIQLEHLKRELTIDTNHEFDWNSFQKQFMKVNPKFIHELFKQCPTLTPTEVKVTCLMRIGLSTKEIMQLMRVTIRDVETHRYKIRKKLGLSTKVNLVTFLSRLSSDAF